MSVEITPNSTRIRESNKQITALRDDANESQIAEHIRGMVAVTMAHLSSQKSDATRNDAEQWQEWALGVADGTRTAS